MYTQRTPGLAWGNSAVPSHLPAAVSPSFRKTTFAPVRANSSGIGKEIEPSPAGVNTPGWNSSPLAWRLQTPVSVLPDSRVSLAEPLAPLHAKVGVPAPTLNSAPP